MKTTTLLSTTIGWILWVTTLLLMFCQPADGRSFSLVPTPTVNHESGAGMPLTTLAGPVDNQITNSMEQQTVHLILTRDGADLETSLTFDRLVISTVGLCGLTNQSVSTPVTLLVNSTLIPPVSLSKKSYEK